MKKPIVEYLPEHCGVKCGTNGCKSDAAIILKIEHDDGNMKNYRLCVFCNANLITSWRGK